MAPLAFLSNPDRLILLILLVRGRLSDLVLGVFSPDRVKGERVLSLCPENSNGLFVHLRLV